jgi:hypothetical protein
VPAYKFEIYEKAAPAVVVETVEFDDLRSFRTYWASQCNSAEYGHRQVEPPTAAAPPLSS